MNETCDKTPSKIRFIITLLMINNNNMKLFLIKTFTIIKRKKFSLKNKWIGFPKINCYLKITEALYE